MTEAATTDWRTAYAQAQKVMFDDGLVHNGEVYPRWIGDTNHFWYDRTGAEGTEYRIVEAATGRGWIAFNRKAIADALSGHFGTAIDPNLLMLSSLAILEGFERAQFDTYGKSWEYDAKTGAVYEAVKQTDRDASVSPDGKLAAFVRDCNLWVRDISNGEERALTTEGSYTFAFGEGPASTRWQKAFVGGGPELVWSPDSRRLLTLATDERQIAAQPYIEFVPEDSRRPRVHENPVSLPGDPNVTEFHIRAIDVASGEQIRPRYPALPAVRMNDTLFAAGLAWWSADSRTAYFVDIERFERAVHVVAFDIATGATRVVFSEKSDSSIDLSVNVYAPALVYPLAETNELIWYSERSGNGHLYLYDLETGALKHPITSGDWRLRDVQQFDPVKRELFFTASGIVPGEDPYICKPCIVSVDGGDVAILSDEPGEHLIWRPGEYLLINPGFLGANMSAISGVSPDGAYFVETVGTAEALPSTYLRRRDGSQIAVIERGLDVGLPADWTWPEAMSFTAADGVSTTYGLLFRPPNYDPNRSYPIVDYIYSGPQVALVPKSAFASGGVMGEFRTAAGLAQLGMFVLIVDGRGTAYRERAFRTASYGAIQDSSNIEDHIAAIRQLAAGNSSIDLDRVGITGFSGGGTSTVMAALRFGDFFKVAVAGGGKYDEAVFEHCWGERYHGPYDEQLYAEAAARTYIDGLTGKLLLIHGMLDGGVHPSNAFQLIQAAIDAEKDIDLILLPRIGHEMTGYGERRRLDYFVTHLFGDTPPKGMKMQTNREFIRLLMKVNATPPA